MNFDPRLKIEPFYLNGAIATVSYKGNLVFPEHPHEGQFKVVRNISQHLVIVRRVAFTNTEDNSRRQTLHAIVMLKDSRAIAGMQCEGLRGGKMLLADYGLALLQAYNKSLSIP